MQPHLIKSTSDSAMTLLGTRGRGTPEALLLSWVAWEGLRVRLLVVGLSLQGWRVQDVYAALSAGRFHHVAHYDNIFRTTFGAKPHNAKGVGAQWQSIEQFRAIRNAYVHGTRGSSPLRLEAGVHLLRDAVMDPSWLSNLPVRTGTETVRLGDPCRRLTSRRMGARSIFELRSLIADARPLR